MPKEREKKVFIATGEDNQYRKLIMETVKQDITDTLWIGFGRKDAPIVQDKTRFLKYFHAWMHPFKFKVLHLDFWPGFAWGTIRMESSDARNVLLKHAIEKPFRPDSESGWVLNKFEKQVPIYTSSPKKSPRKVSKDSSNNTLPVSSKKRSSVADTLLIGGASKDHGKKSTSGRNRKSRSSTASPATTSTVNNHEVLDLDDLEHKRHTGAVFEEDEDDSELRVRATITKVINGVRVVEALTKKHGIYKLSINDILGASKFKPNDLTGADIVIVLGPLKKNQRRRDFLWAELSEDWNGPPINTTNKVLETADGNGSLEPADFGGSLTGSDMMGHLIKEETLDNALVNLKKFYKWSIKDQEDAQKQIKALLDEVQNAESMQTKIAIISDHLTLASQSFQGNVDPQDDESIEDLITSTRCSSAFSNHDPPAATSAVKRVVSNVDYEKDHHFRSNQAYRRSDIIVKEDSMEDKIKMMQEMVPTDDNDDYDSRNILNLSDSPLPTNGGSKSRQASAERSRPLMMQPSVPSSVASSTIQKKGQVFDLPTSRQTIKANASSYTVESSSEIQIDMLYWQKMLHWLTVHHFDHHKDHAKDHAKWVVITWELAGITPTNLKSEIIGHQQTVTNFCTRLAEMLEAKKSKIPFWNNLSISNIIHATLCYLLSKNFPAESVPIGMAELFSTVPFGNGKTGSVFQMRGYVDKYISEEKGLLMSPKGYVLFNSFSIIGKKSNSEDLEAADEEESLTFPIGTHVLFNAVKVEEVIDNDGKKYKYYVATNVWIETDFQIYYDDLSKQISVLHTSAMAKVLNRANSNLSDEAILSMYEDGLSKVGKSQGRIDLKNLLVDKATMESLQPLVDFLRTRLELRLDMASNVSLMYASMWARIGYDLNYLRDDYHSLSAIGSRGCVTYNWEKLLLNFKLPNCLEMGHLVRETLAFFSTSSSAGQTLNIDLVDGKSLYELAVKRARVDRHHQLLIGNYQDASLLIPQPFQRARILEALLRPKSSYSEDITEKNPEDSTTPHVNGDIAKEALNEPQEIKVHPENEQVLTFEANADGNLDADLVDAIVKGTIAFKYRIRDNVWRVISKSNDVFPKPPDGWRDREYIPIRKQTETNAFSKY